jgi:tetratricopeptide (TPR) repeat protein
MEPAPRRRAFNAHWIIFAVFLGFMLWFTNRDRDFKIALSNGESALASKDWERAREHFGKALKDKPDFARAHHGLGRACYQLEQFDEAAEAFAKAASLQPGAYEHWRGLGRARRRQKRWDDAIAAYLETLRLKPDHAPATFELGSCYEGAGRTEEAVDLYRRYGAVKHREGAWSVAFGKNDLSGENIPGYWQAYERVLKLRPDDPEAHYYVGLANVHAEATEVARKHLAALDRLHATEFAEKLKFAIEFKP